MRHEIRFSGLGGQGIITAAVILGRAAALYTESFVVQTQSYGPEARGGASASAVIISDEPIYYPKVMNPKLYVIMSEAAFQKYGRDAPSDAVMLIDPGYVRSRPSCRCIEVPATSAAKEQLGKPVFANVIMLAAFWRRQTLFHMRHWNMRFLTACPKEPKRRTKPLFPSGGKL